MPRRTLPVVLFLAVLAGAAGAVGVSGNLDSFLVLATDLRAGLDPGSPDKLIAKKAKTLDKLLAGLEDPRLEASWADELKGASKAAKIVEKKLAEEPGLLAELEGALALYEADFATAAQTLTNEAAAETDPKLKAKLEKDLAKATATLAAAQTELLASKKIKLYAKAAKILEPWLGESSPAGWSWVLSEVQTLPAGQGLDLTGDMVPDNALGARLADLSDMGFDLNQTLTDHLASTTFLTAFWVWELDSFSDDPEVRFSLQDVFDADASPGDNFGGTETFRAETGIGPDALPQSWGVFALVEGDYIAVLPPRPVNLAGLSLGATAPVRLEGSLSAEGSAGVAAGAIRMDDFVGYLRANGLDLDTDDRENTVRSWADLDLDGLEGNDAISAGFAFDSVPCGLDVIVP